MENLVLRDDGLVDDGMPWIFVKGTLRDSRGEVWRVGYTIGGREFVVSRADGVWYLDDLKISRPGSSRGVRRYTSWARAFSGLLAARRRIFGKVHKQA